MVATVSKTAPIKKKFKFNYGESYLFNSDTACAHCLRSAKAQPIHLRLSKGRPTDELNERPLQGPKSTVRSCYTEIRNRTLHLSSNQICRFNT